jgi:hypothetical protein
MFSGFHESNSDGGSAQTWQLSRASPLQWKANEGPSLIGSGLRGLAQPQLFRAFCWMGKHLSPVRYDPEQPESH